MANFVVANSTTFAGVAQNNLGATYATQVAIAASSGGMVGPPVATGLKRGRVYDLLIGTNGTPADNEIEWGVLRVTAASTVAWLGSVSSVSSGLVLDGGDAGPASFITINASAETNLAATGLMWYMGMNQRASYRWIAAPGSELVWPAATSATGNNGLAVKTRSAAYTSTVTTTVYGSEL